MMCTLTHTEGGLAVRGQYGQNGRIRHGRTATADAAAPPNDVLDGGGVDLVVLGEREATLGQVVLGAKRPALASLPSPAPPVSPQGQLGQDLPPLLDHGIAP